VQNNPLQKKKNVRPRSVNPPETKISFMGYKDNKNLQNLMKRMVARVPADKTAYIISRYTYDINALCSPDFTMEYDQNHDSVAINIAGRKIKFMTIHGSKGLEADYVFLLNCNSGLYGFPSLVSDDPVLDYVLSDPEHYEYAEERRVFYVGITRAKVHTVVLYNEDTPSPFVSEMNANVRVNPNPCPWCGVGHRIVKYEGWTKQKTPYKVWGCDNREANCQYFEREFYKGDYMQLKGRKFIYTKRRIH
jgi:DNA helicase-4